MLTKIRQADLKILTYILTNLSVVDGDLYQGVQLPPLYISDIVHQAV